MFNTSRALAIEGWMEPAEINWLAKQAQSHRLIIEIGSYLGRSTRALLDNTVGIVIAIDDFHGPREIELAGRATIYERFLSNTADCKNLVVVKVNHRELPEPEFTPDMVFIDGAHEYEAVKADILYWLPRIAQDGIISGHDYGWSRGVEQAVHETLPAFQIAQHTSIWFSHLSTSSVAI